MNIENLLYIALSSFFLFAIQYNRRLHVDTQINLIFAKINQLSERVNIAPKNSFEIGQIEESLGDLKGMVTSLYAAQARRSSTRSMINFDFIKALSVLFNQEERVDLEELKQIAFDLNLPSLDGLRREEAVRVLMTEVRKRKKTLDLMGWVTKNREDIAQDVFPLN
jgi:hypothetical protein